MNKSTKTHVVRFATSAPKKTPQSSFLMLAKKNITKVGTKEAKNASRDIDVILYGRKSLSR